MKNLLNIIALVLLLSCSIIEEEYIIKERCFIELNDRTTLYFDSIKVSTDGTIIADGRKFKTYKSYYCPIYVMKNEHPTPTDQ